jgi:predicted phosphoribosyltransferase
MKSEQVRAAKMVCISVKINKTSNEKEVIIVDDGSDVGAGLSGSGW